MCVIVRTSGVADTRDQYIRISHEDLSVANVIFILQHRRCCGARTEGLNLGRGKAQGPRARGRACRSDVDFARGVEHSSEVPNLEVALSRVRAGA